MAEAETIELMVYHHGSYVCHAVVVGDEVRKRSENRFMGVGRGYCDSLRQPLAEIIGGIGDSYDLSAVVVAQVPPNAGTHDLLKPLNSGEMSVVMAALRGQ